MKTIPCTGCSYCSKCPSSVAIPFIFGAYNQCRKTDNLQEDICPQHIVVPKMLKMVRSKLE